MYLVYKGGYKKDGKGVLLSKKSEDICKACRTSIMEFLEGKNTTPAIKQGNEGGSIRLDVYFNKVEGIAYAQLYDFCNYTYEPATGIVELKGLIGKGPLEINRLMIILNKRIETMGIKRYSYVLLAFGLLSSALCGSEANATRPHRNRMTVASEKVIARSPSPEDIFLYTPAIIEGLNGRLVVAVDYGGPGTDKLDGPKSGFGDYKAGNQMRIMYSDDRGRTWKDSPARIPMMHEILFKAGETLYMVGHAGILLASRSDDNGVTWSEPSILCDRPRWHQSCGAVDIHDGKVTLVYEKWIGDSHPWPGVGPVLMQGRMCDDLTKAENWKFSELYNPDPDLIAAKPSGAHVLPTTFEKSPAPGILESNVVRVYDPKRPFYDPSGKSVVIMMRAATGFPDMGVMLKGVENPDGSLAIGKLHKDDGDLFLTHIPGANLKFHICYDPRTKLYWMVHSQITGNMNERRRLALSYSPDLLRWTFAGIVAIGPSDNGARHYATMCISGDDIFIVSRSGDEKARNAHDNNLTTFHKIKDFRKLIY